MKQHLTLLPEQQTSCLSASFKTSSFNHKRLNAAIKGVNVGYNAAYTGQTKVWDNHHGVHVLAQFRSQRNKKRMRWNMLHRILLLGRLSCTWSGDFHARVYAAL
jgi:hypothetical protein